MFPYFYVPYDEDLPSEPGPAHAYLRKLAQAIEIGMRANSQVRAQFSCGAFPLTVIPVKLAREADKYTAEALKMCPL